METTAKTNTRPDKKRTAVVVPEQTAPEAPAAPPVAPQGVVLPTVTNDPAALSPAAIEVADQAQNSAPIVVPAPVPVDPNAPTAEQIATAKLIADRMFLRFYRQRPMAQDAAPFVPMTDEAIEEAAFAHKKEHGGTLVAAINKIQAEDAARAAAHAALIANAAPINDLWIDAALGIIRGLELTVVNMRSKPVQVASKTRSKAVAADAKLSSTDRKVSGTSAEKAARRVAYVESFGLHVDLIDQTEGGYEGVYHALRLHSDGRYEALNYDAAAKTVTPTGTFLSGWKDAFANSPKYSVHQMYGILDPKGKLGANLKGKKAHLADVQVVFAAADSAK
jgi:hypothetical protein